MIEGQKIVSAQEMARIEQLSFLEGASPAEYMENAGLRIAEEIDFLIGEWNLEREVTLFIGKGNNGGDALVAGFYLLEQGYEVSAFALFDIEEVSPLCLMQWKRFEAAGGEVLKVNSHLDIYCSDRGVIVDGIFGTGFQGTTTGLIREVIAYINELDIPIIAIDIPSALEIHATVTLYLGLPKIEFFQKGAFGNVGRLMGIDFGMNVQKLEEAKGVAYLYDESATEKLMPKIKRCRHKYEAGYVVALAGSKGMSGAAFLACLAALRTGAGIVRLFHPPGMGGNPPMELICEEWSHESILKEAQRASAFIIGPGLGSFYPVQEVVGQLSAPCVVDGDGLYLLKDIEIFAPHIFTPHVGEMTRLLGTYPTLELCQAYSEEKGATIVLKGAPTFIFHPGCQPVIVTAGDPGMATAGSGDVLTGMIAALLAQGMEGREAAILGVYLHGKAGEEAAKKYTSYSMIASDLIQSVNLVIPSTRGVWGE